ncbi:MAG: prolyl oligopeptidase family serine peptidase [Sedimentisphaerales bacterium]|nr:prolyl oligopeptidase family serine peptidase [Sedimentisphaerales bacterium]
MSTTNYRISLKLTISLLILGEIICIYQNQNLFASTSLEPDYHIQNKNVLEQPPRTKPQNRPMVRGYYKARITPNWFNENNFFWYRNDLKDNTTEFILVDTEQGIRQKAFDHEKLATALSQAAGTDYTADKLPFERIEFIDNLKKLRFTLKQTTWICDLTSYTCSRTEEKPLQASQEPSSQKPRSGSWRGRRQSQSMDSPDSRWTALVKENNVFIRLKDGDKEIQLSTDGTKDNSYGRFSWSPDSKILVVFRIEPGDNKEVYLIESSPEGGGRAKFHSRPYTLPGDKFTGYELNLFDIDSRKQIKPEVDKLELDWQVPQLHWKKDQRHFAYEKIDRGHQRFRVIEVDSHTGQTCNLIDEKSETFIWTAHTENLRLNRVNWLDETNEIIYVSEMDGWRHLYLVSSKHRNNTQQITKGKWVVRGIDLIDENKRQIWFHASGKNPDQDPYMVHYYRINFDGTGLTELTEGNGTHSIRYSPDRRYLIDTYSLVDTPPEHKLRRASDGSLVCNLDKADISELVAEGWTAPEVFVAKGRNGRTDIWGIICRPCDFDPNKKYPVIEYIYAGPQSAYVPKRFSPVRRFSFLRDLGFIVVQIDAMGTAHRSKAFHDVCWKNLKDAGFPDRILWHKTVAKKYPYYDINRLGIYGNSAGGQNAASAVLFHPEFYKVAVASCGCHDNRMDKASWNEQWMGYPVGPQYSKCSNIDNAYRLQGRLMLIVGEMDNNVPPESTMRFADALIKADKDFDLLVIPGAGHGSGSSYGQRRMQDFFIRHLQGVEPPNHNAPSKD